MGLGTITGTLVGTVATIPGVLVGGLVGAGVGVIHGPWIKLGGKDKSKGAGPETKIPAEAVENGSVIVDQKTGQVKTVDKEGLERARKAAEQAEKMQKEGGSGNGGSSEVKKEKKKPRKLEVRKKP